MLHLWRCDVSGATCRRSLRSIFNLGAGQRLGDLLLLALILNFDIGSRCVTRIVQRLLIVVVDFSNLVQSVLLRRVECLVRGVAGALTMAGTTSLSSCLSTSLMA